MIALYVGGEKVGTLADAERLIPVYVARKEQVEFRDDAGNFVGAFVPGEPICPWDPTLTKEKLDQMSAAGGGIPLAEFWKRMGVQ